MLFTYIYWLLLANSCKWHFLYFLLPCCNRCNNRKLSCAKFLTLMLAQQLKFLVISLFLSVPQNWVVLILACYICGANFYTFVCKCFLYSRQPTNLIIYNHIMIKRELMLESNKNVSIFLPLILAPHTQHAH